VALAAWPLALAPSTGQEAATAFQPKGDGEGQLDVAERVEADMPSGLTPQITHAMVAHDLVVDAQGAVTSVRPVTFQIRNMANGAQLSASHLKALRGLIDGVAAQLPSGKPLPFTDAETIVRDVDAMRQSASTALARWRFEPPAAAPAIARVAIVFDLQANKATTGPATPISGFAGVAGLPTRTVFARRPGAGAPSDGTLRVGGEIRAPQKVVNVSPVYPQEAQDARVQGVVIIEAKIAADGSVAEAWVLRSIPMLDQAALDAVRQWRYTPTLMNGVPVPVIMTVTVNFTLEQ
jgi:protein TonB